MSFTMPDFAYLSAVQSVLMTGEATEHSYRPAVRDLFTSFGLVALNEPKRVECGAPDFKVSNRHKNLVGHVECKDVGVDLDKELKSKQMGNYLGALPNLLFTNQLEWRWYEAGKHRETVKVGRLDGRRVVSIPGGSEALEALVGRFTACQVVAPATPKDLARNLAAKARLAREYVAGALRERDSAFRGLQEVFGKALKPMADGEFADVLAQTLTYGLFAQWAEGGTVPKAMPFLRTFLTQVLRTSEDDLDAGLEKVEWVVAGTRDLLGRTSRDVLAGFGAGTGMTDPILHFYENFLDAYDPVARKSKGVWYTPQPVVDHIVEAIDLKLREDLGKPDGLADPGVVILDPACGSGAFLLAVLRKIRKTLGEGGFTRAVRDGLLDRVFGLELMMAPYAVAHLAIYRMLRDAGCSVPDKKRVGVFLTDTLADPPKVGNEYGDTPLGSLGMLSAPAITKALADEAEGARKVKETEPVVVVLGNPPYNGASTNKGAWITGLMEDYKRGLEGERNTKWLQDDYVKFWRFAQHVVSRDLTRGGVVGFITPHGWLDAPTFRGMRASILDTFDKVDVLDLHGNGNKKERTPEALLEEVGDDENVFDIKQGVAITIAVRSPAARLVRTPRVRWAEAWGAREQKFKAIVGAVPWMVLRPEGLGYLLVGREGDSPEYVMGWSVKDIFPKNSIGVVTSRDDLVVGFTKPDLKARIADFADVRHSDAEVQEKYDLHDNRDWCMSDARKRIAAEGVPDDLFMPILYRPLDTRVIYFSPREIDRPRTEVMQHLLRPETGNLALCTVRQTQQDLWAQALITNAPIPNVGVEMKDASSTFPLYLLPTDDPLGIIGFATPTKPAPRPNLSPAFITAFTQSTGLTFDPADPKTAGDDLTSKWTPLDLLHYCYGVLHDPTYRVKNQEALKRDFPRIPVPTAETLPRARVLRTLGEKLVALHLPDRWSVHPDLARKVLTVRDLPAGSDVVEKVSREPDAVRINPSQCFDGVTDEVWEARIGGYQPAQKWLKDRKGRTLTSEDVLHYRRLCQVLAETARLMWEVQSASLVLSASLVF